MQPYLIKANAWHLQLIKRWTSFGDHEIGKDSCTYIKQLLLALIVLLGTSVCVAGLLWCYMDLIMASWFYVSTDLNYGDMGKPGEFAVAITLGVGAVVGVFSFFYWLDNYRTAKLTEKAIKKQLNLPEPEPSFMQVIYRSLKGRYCVQLTLEEDLQKERQQRAEELT